MTSFWEILKSSKSLKASDAFAELWGKSIADSWDIITITGSLPLSFLSKGEALTNYRLYGTAEGAGVQTESGEPTGYQIPLTVTSGEQTDNLFDKNATDINNGYVDGYHLKRDGTTGSNSSWAISEYMPITGGLNYTFNYGTSSSSPAICYYDSNRHYISGVPYGGQNPKVVSVPQNVSYIRFSFMKNHADDIMFVQADSLPDHYIPHRYSTTTPIYIGSTKLGAEEYVDYQEQKVWKMVDGTLTPTDPPVALPELSTYQGENTLSSTETVGEVSVTGKIKEI